MSATLHLGIKDGGEPMTADLAKLVDTRVLVQANSGGGKSWMLRLLAEQAAPHVQVIIIDPEGEFSTLRSKFDMLLVSASGGEIPASLKTAKAIAHKLTELRVSAVIDLSEMALPLRRQYVRDFCTALVAVKRAHWHELLVMLDEAHQFCPERSAGEACSTDAVIALMSLGRKRGFCGVLATQRLSKLHKDAAAECNNIFIGRTGLDVDQKRAGDLLGLDKTGRTALRSLPPGEFFAFGPALAAAGVTQFKSAEVVTQHPSAGDRVKLTAPKPSANIAKLLPELAAIESDEQVYDLEHAQGVIADLKRKLEHFMLPAAPVADPAAIEDAVRQAVMRRDSHWQTVIARAREDLLDRMAQLTRDVEAAGRSVAELGTGTSAPFGEVLHQVAAEQEMAQAKRMERILYGDAPVLTTLEENRKRAATVKNAAFISGKAQPIIPPVIPDPAGREALTGPERRILDAAAWWHALGVTEPGRQRIAIVAGKHQRTKSFINACGSLRSKGLLDGDVITSAGLAVADRPSTAPSLHELHQRIRNVLNGVQQRMFDLIAQHHGRIGRAELADAMGYHERTKSFINALGRLSGLGIVTHGGGAVRGTDLMYPNGSNPGL